MTEELRYIQTGNLFADTGKIIESARNTAYRAVNYVLVQRNWYLGRRIAEELIGDQTREELYGKSLVQDLAKQLTSTYGSGFDFSSLYKYIRFYQCFPNILDAASPKSFLLSWTHYRGYKKTKPDNLTNQRLPGLSGAKVRQKNDIRKFFDKKMQIFLLFSKK